MTPVLKEAELLYKLGFALLWIKPKSKAPVKSKWTTGPRETWEELKKSYRPGFNLGVRLGSPSIISGKFLAVIDIDVKSNDQKHQVEAKKAVRELFPNLPETVVQVLSGRGNGSSHLYIVTKEPAKPLRLRVSADKTKVMMPSVAPSQVQKEQLSEEDLNEGWRMRPAWEVSVMGEGQQVVLPPSVHPDTGKNYIWKVRPTSQAFCEINLEFKKKEFLRTETNSWQPEEYDLTFSSLPNDIINLIMFADCDDRSQALFKVAIAMIREGLTDKQMMSILTDREYELGKTAYDHAKTEDRGRAANWVYNYTLKKARKETDARFQFNEEVETSELRDEDAAKQVLELITPPDWKTQIDRCATKGVNSGVPRTTLKNVVLILTNEVSSDIFKRNAFEYRDFYNYNTPWGGKKDQLIGNDDPINIKLWLSRRYRFEPSRHLISEAIAHICSENSFDPVHDWLEGLPEWDGVNRLDTWLVRNFEAEGNPDYLAQVFRKWLVAMVLRVYEPGAKFDWLPIFEGKQGVGKSSLGRLLVGDKYFVDWLPDLTDKDSALALQGAWCVEFGELANIRKQEIEAVKAFVTRTVDKVRPPYAPRWVEIPRRCVFFGTTNSDTYLRDDSGNRRFKPIKVGNLNFDAVAYDREQLFAEALFIYKNGFETSKTLDIEGDARDYELEVQSEKMIEDDSAFMVDSLQFFIKKMTSEDPTNGVTFNLRKFRLTELFDEFSGPLKGYRSDMRNLQYAAKAVKSLGGERFKSSGAVFWRFKALPLPYSPTLFKNGKTHENITV